MRKRYKLREIFYSLQGEGYWAGTPSVFVRFAGCNLSCPFCDTDYSLKFTMDSNELVSELCRYKVDRVVLTGGEPALQVDYSLVETLKEAGFYLQIETNGTELLPEGIDWVTVSPKEGAVLRVTSGNELKVVFYGQSIDVYEALAFRYRFLQPCERNGRMNLKETVNEVLRRKGIWRLSLQTQKFLGIM